MSTLLWRKNVLRPQQAADVTRTFQTRALITGMKAQQICVDFLVVKKRQP